MLPHFYRRTAIALVALLAATGPQASACGPDFPNTYLSNSLSELTSLPALSFERELERLLVQPRRQRLPVAEVQRRCAEAERAEVRAALLAHGVSGAALEDAVAHYDRLHPSAALPTEFHLYARAARAWHDRRANDAVALWRQLLALPPAERRYRTVWAHFMLGRALADSEPAEAAQACKAARTAADTGFADSQELAVAALGWEARALWRQGDFAGALRLYHRQFALGDPTALASIQLTLQRVFRGTGERWQYAIAPAATPGREEGEMVEANIEPAAGAEALRQLAGEPDTRRIVSAWFAARGGPAAAWSGDTEATARWLDCLRRVADLSPDESNRACWAAYQAGRWEDATHFARRAPEDAPASEWVRAMLLLRGGFIDEAAGHLARAARTFETDPALVPPDDAGEPWERRVESQPLRDSPAGHLAGLRGTLALCREHYVEALRVLLLAKHWEDAAYVAERILTIEELTAFVRAEVPPRPRLSERSDYTGDIRHLLGRRLVRAGKFDAAREFFPAHVQDDYNAYLAAVRSGFDSNRPAHERAASLWRAARLERERGLEIRGTELAPDFAVTDGNYPWPDLAAARTQMAAAIGGGDEALRPSADELRRLERITVPTRRFHYRYRAAELAWLAAGLSPNDDEATAQILNTAGRWLAARDPEQAQLFYRSLLVRCPTTATGRQAAAKRWFVEPEPEREP